MQKCIQTRTQFRGYRHVGCLGASAFWGSGVSLGLSRRSSPLRRQVALFNRGFEVQLKGLPIGPEVVPFYSLYLESYKVIPKRNYLGAYGKGIGFTGYHAFSVPVVSVAVIFGCLVLHYSIELNIPNRAAIMKTLAVKSS